MLRSLSQSPSHKLSHSRAWSWSWHCEGADSRHNRHELALCIASVLLSPGVCKIGSGRAISTLPMHCSGKAERAALPCSAAGLCFAAVEDFCELVHEMESWGQVPRQLRTALAPESAVRHAKKMLGRDDRMPVFMAEHSQYGAMYLCQQAHIDLAEASTSGGITSASDHSHFSTSDISSPSWSNYNNSKNAFQLMMS